MKTQIKRVVAMVLVIAMTMSLVGCSLFQKTTPNTTEEAIQSTVDLQQAQQNMEISAPAEYNKNDMKEMLNCWAALLKKSKIWTKTSSTIMLRIFLLVCRTVAQSHPQSWAKMMPK